MAWIKDIGEVAWVVYPAHEFFIPMGMIPGKWRGPALLGVFWPGFHG